YTKYGGGLVAACARAGTHYCDLAGEVPWVRRMIDAHEKTAEDSGAILIPCSGFDSIPSDLGVLYLQLESQSIFGRPAQRVHFLLKKADGGVSGGTVSSMLEIASEAQSSARTRQLLRDPYSLNPKGTTGDDKTDSLGFGRDELSGEWVAPFLMAAINTRVVRRSAALLSELYGPQFRYAEYVTTGSGATAAMKAAAVSAAMASLFVGAALPPTRALLAKALPKPGDGPDDKARTNGCFVIDLVGLTDAGESITVRVTGDRDPGYGATSRMLGETAYLLSQRKMTKHIAPGFRTPATAGGRHLIDALQERGGMSFVTRAHSPAG
ncbi:MAG: saccharopine dehydrogenase, partial [Pseudomonadota bacterium]